MNKPLSSKQELLDVAQDILIRKGDKGLSLREIASKAHISLGAVYHYFASKEEIVGALMESFWKGVFLKGLCEEDISSLSSLEILKKVNSLLYGHYEAFSSLFSLASGMSAPKKMFESQYITHFVSKLSQVMRKEDPTGAIFHPPISYESYASFLFSSLIDGLLRGPHGNDTLLALHERLMQGGIK